MAFLLNSQAQVVSGK